MALRAVRRVPLLDQPAPIAAGPYPAAAPVSGWAGGSSRAWRRIRLAVLERDGWRCQVPVAHRAPSGLVLLPGHDLTSDDPRAPTHATVGHLDKRDAGGSDDPRRLRAECAAWNYSDGATYGNTKRRTPRRIWSWDTTAPPGHRDAPLV